MGIVKTETFTNENGVEMRKDTYANGMTITQTANPPEAEPVYLPSEAEIAQAKLDYLLMLAEG